MNKIAKKLIIDDIQGKILKDTKLCRLIVQSYLRKDESPALHLGRYYFYDGYKKLAKIFSENTYVKTILKDFNTRQKEILIENMFRYLFKYRYSRSKDSYSILELIKMLEKERKFAWFVSPSRWKVLETKNGKGLLREFVQKELSKKLKYVQKYVNYYGNEEISNKIKELDKLIQEEL